MIPVHLFFFSIIFFISRMLNVLIPHILYNWLFSFNSYLKGAPGYWICLFIIIYCQRIFRGSIYHSLFNHPTIGDHWVISSLGIKKKTTVSTEAEVCVWTWVFVSLASVFRSTSAWCTSVWFYKKLLNGFSRAAVPFDIFPQVRITSCVTISFWCHEYFFSHSDRCLVVSHSF